MVVRTPGRVVDVGGWQQHLEAGGLVRMHPTAAVFLGEFGGLRVEIDGPGGSTAREPFELDPDRAKGDADRFAEWGADQLSNVLTTRLATSAGQCGLFLSASARPPGCRPSSLSNAPAIAIRIVRGAPSVSKRPTSQFGASGSRRVTLTRRDSTAVPIFAPARSASKASRSSPSISRTVAGARRSAMSVPDRDPRSRIAAG